MRREDDKQDRSNPNYFQLSRFNWVKVKPTGDRAWPLSTGHRFRTLLQNLSSNSTEDFFSLNGV